MSGVYTLTAYDPAGHLFDRMPRRCLGWAGLGMAMLAAADAFSTR